MDSEAAFEFITALVELAFPKTGKRLPNVANVDEHLIKGAVIGKSYQEIHKDIHRDITHHICGVEHLKKNCAPKLWDFLSNLLGERVTKNTLRSVVGAAYRRRQHQEALSQPGQDEGRIPLPPTSSDVENPLDTHLPSDQGDETGQSRAILVEPLPTNLQYTFQKKITLIAENPGIITRENLSRELRCEPKTKSSWEMLDLIDTPSGGNNNWRWEDLVNHLPLEDSQRWSEQLMEAIYLAHLGTIPRVVQLTFRSPVGKLYRPVLDEIEILSDGSKRFTVIFEELISEGWVYNAPNLSLATLLTALDLGARLQWGVCRKYLRQLELCQQEGTSSIERILRRIELSFASIEDDAELRRQGETPDQNLRNEDRLRDAFDSEEQDTIALNLSEQWQHKETLLNASNQGDIDQVINALTELYRLNEIVMRMIIKRFGELF